MERRDCRAHVRELKTFATYYHSSWLYKDSPEPWAVQPPEFGRIVAIPQVGGLNHRHDRRAA
jgi:hypothetical protein